MERYKIPDVYAVWSKDDTVRFTSTSGGAFSEFAKVFLSEGGLIAGARFNYNNLVEHAIVGTLEGIEELRQSKYMSSSLGDSYKKIKEELVNGKLLAFCGSPCQVAGLYSYLGREYDNLFTMDFICRGMNSPKAFKSWLNEIEEREGSKVTKVWFKYKEGGWKSSPRRTRLDFENGTYKIFSNEKNLYMDGYLSSNLYIRPCCGNCKFKGVPRKSDVTFADFWGIEKKYDDDKGISMLLINSQKGERYFEKIRNNIIVHKKKFDDIYNGNPMFSTSAVIPESGHDFLVDLDHMTFSQAIKKYETRMQMLKKYCRKVKRTIKKILRRV